MFIFSFLRLTLAQLHLKLMNRLVYTILNIIARQSNHEYLAVLRPRYYLQRYLLRLRITRHLDLNLIYTVVISRQLRYLVFC